jgi:tRNA threonylcarbamoyladenosine biosynthesis protein TsaB
LILALDTCLGACSAALVRGAHVLAARSEPMERGHQERLAPLVAEVMKTAGAPFGAVERIAVTTGPGSFTGLRVGLAFAKGLGLALGKPVLGVGTLHALAVSAEEAPLTAAVVDARREQVYLQPFRRAAALADPVALSAVDGAARLAAFGGPWRLVGSGGPLLAPLLNAAALDPRSAPDPVVIAQLAASAAPGSARPVYLRAPDAKLPA